MPRRAPWNPTGWYHVGSRGCYGQPLFRSDDEHELFLTLVGRATSRYAIKTLAWTLMVNHHHFVVRLTKGGLSECMREVHGRYSRRIHAVYGQTRAGHLVRHAFFARELATEAEVLVACRYVDLNTPMAVGGLPSDARWCGYRATIGLGAPRSFHEPAELLKIASPHTHAARAAYRFFVEAGLDPSGRGSSPNQRYGSRTAHA
jgi:REP element-mobilizing transposase RayT